MSVPPNRVLRKRPRADDPLANAPPAKRPKLAKELTVTTWNTQRTASFLSSGKDKDALARAAEISRLTTKYDVLMVTEPGKGFREAVSSGSSPCSDATKALPSGGNWYASSLPDNQSDASACRPVLFVSGKVGSSPKPLSVRHKSGAKTAHRFPAAATIDVGGGNHVALVSFHATSGFGGADDTQNMLDELTPGESSSNKSFGGFILGGDLNCKDAKFGGTRKTKGPTQQRGGNLDGFAADGGSDVMIVQEGDAEPVPGFELRTRTSHPDEKPGCYRVGGSVRLSDHLPVTTIFKIYLPDDEA